MSSRVSDNLEALFKYLSGLEKYQNQTKTPVNLFEESPRKFLEYFWRDINLIQAQDLKEHINDDGFLMYYSRKIRNFQRKDDVNTRNERFKAMKALMKEDSYFTIGDMKNRNPVLYDELIGQLLTDAEVVNLAVEQYEQYQCASQVLLGQIDNLRTSELYYKLLEKEGEAGRCINNIEEFEDDEDDVMDSDEVPSSRKKDVLTREFISEMEQRFLSGVDSKVITNTSDADFDQDNEDEYFDSEEPVITLEGQDATSKDDTDTDDYMTMDLSKLV